MIARRRFEIGDGHDLLLSVSDFGASWLSCRVRAGDGTLREVLLGHAELNEYGRQGGYVGAIVGRYANRIADAGFTLDGRAVQLLANEGRNQLHGGPEGFDKRTWQVEIEAPARLRLKLHSPAGDQGYPGNVTAWVDYQITGPRELTVTFEAITDAPCPVSLTSHAYFNLDGPVGGQVADIRRHRLQLRADHYLPVRDDLIPIGELAPVQGTRFDLRQSRELGGEPFDHAFLLEPGAGPAAVLTATDGRLAMDLYTDYPCLQLYSGQWLPLNRDRADRPCPAYGWLALEPQFLPDAPNHPEWLARGGLLRPGERLSRRMVLRFSTPSDATPDETA